MNESMTIPRGAQCVTHISMYVCMYGIVSGQSYCFVGYSYGCHYRVTHDLAYVSSLAMIVNNLTIEKRHLN